jgi:hypothetical protein
MLAVLAAIAITGLGFVPASARASTSGSPDFPGYAATQGWMQGAGTNIYVYGVMTCVNGKYSGMVTLSGFVGGQYCSLNSMISNPVFTAVKDSSGVVVSSMCSASVNVIFNRVPASLTFEWTDSADGLTFGNVAWTIRNLSTGALMTASPTVAAKMPYVIVRLPN